MIYIRFSGHVVGFASVARAMELKPVDVKVAAAPIQHLIININANISPGELFLLEPVVSKMLRKATAAAAYVHKMGIRAAQS